MNFLKQRARLTVAGILTSLALSSLVRASENKERRAFHNTGLQDTPDDGEQRPENFIDSRAGSLEVEAHGSDLPTAGYERSPGSGAFIQSEDGSFRLQFGAYAQVRWTGSWSVPSGEDSNHLTQGWSVRRAQFFFEGKYSKSLAYQLRPVISNSSDFQLQVAWLQINLSKRWSLRAGRQFMPLSREDWMLPQDLLTTEVSAHAATFAFGPSFGSFVRYGGDKHRAWVALHNAAPSQVDPIDSPGHDVAGSARWEWNLHGDDWSVWGDQVGRQGRPTVIMLGTSGLIYDHDGDEADDKMTEYQVNLDLNVNVSGFHSTMTGTSQWVRQPGANQHNWGFATQMGYFVVPTIQTYAQFAFVAPVQQTGEIRPFQSVVMGVNTFPFLWTNRWRLTLEGGMTLSSINGTLVSPSTNLGFLASDEPHQGYARLQAQFGF